MTTTLETRVVNIFEASLKDRQVFIDRVKGHHGNIEVQVHPFFIEPERARYLGIKFNPKFFPDRDRFLSGCFKKGVPLLFLEEYGKCNDLPKRIRTESPALIFTIPCGDTDPKPFRGSWRDTTKALISMGVIHANVGGIYSRVEAVNRQGLDSNESERRRAIFSELKTHIERLKNSGEDPYRIERLISKGLIPNGCVGGVITEFLKYGINASLSPLGLPGYFAIA